ncbi:Fic family protein [Pseudomonas sp. Leaf58]|uniref:Fic family protein n=1 Tax=Pseudomonas sp. Leaf58 TaxID=1736226 RepID=UPI000A910C86|nr:Fic family protein [Pseudomonas sp. Leaf58]
MSNKEKIKELFKSTTYRTRRNAEFKRSFLEFSPGVGQEALSRLDELFPKKISLNSTQKAGLMIDLAWSSSKLEGNPYSHLDTIKLLTYGTLPKNASAEDTQMIINHKHAFDLVRNTADISLRMLREVHRCLADPGDIEGDTQHFVKKHELGLIRETETMSITHTAYTPPVFYPGNGSERIYDLIDYTMNAASEIENPVESAFYILTRVPYIQAFYDANKRTSRIMANVPLLAAGCMPISYDIMQKSDYLEAIMAVYEFVDTEIFRDVFLESYTDSYLKYYPIPPALDDDIRLDLRGYQQDLANFVISGEKTGRVEFFLAEVSGKSLRRKPGQSDLDL